MVTVLVALQAERLPALPAWKVSGTTPMPTRFERWMRSKLWAMTARTPRRLVPLAAQSREEPVPYSLAGEDDERHALRLVAAWRRRRSASLRRSGWCSVKPPSLAAEHLVLDADVGEGAPHHHLVVAAPRAVLVEVGRATLMVGEVLHRRARPP
jgi:hypothetical protein